MLIPCAYIANAVVNNFVQVGLSFLREQHYFLQAVRLTIAV